MFQQLGTPAEIIKKKTPDRRRRRLRFEQSLIFILQLMLLSLLLQFSTTFVNGQAKLDVIENEEFLREQLPRIQVDEKKSVKIECKLNETLENFDFHVVWMRTSKWRWLKQNVSHEHMGLNSKMFKRNGRFKIFNVSRTLYYMTINDARYQDGGFIYICRAQKIINPKSRLIKRPKEGLIGGAKLIVLLPMKILEDETSPGIVKANEYEPVKLRCAVGDMNPNLIDWERQDGEPIRGANESKLHWLPQWTNNTMVNTWKSGKTLTFKEVLREHAGVYLCSGTPASKERIEDKQTGVQKRIELIVENCRQYSDKLSSREACSMSRRIKLPEIDENHLHLNDYRGRKKEPEETQTQSVVTTTENDSSYDQTTTDSSLTIDANAEEATTTVGKKDDDDTDENMQHLEHNAPYVYASSSSGLRKSFIDAANCPIWSFSMLLAQTIVVTIMAHDGSLSY